MSSLRVISLVVAVVCLGGAGASVGAQTCSISSTARGPLSCSVTTTMRMTVRIPSMVGVTMTTDAPAVAVGRTIRAGLSVRTNRSYALQISRAPMDSVDSFAVAGSYQRPITWSTPVASAELADRPTQIDALGAPATGQTPIHVAFARDAQSDVAPVDPIRLLLTIVAP
jgi:hypothetical protein